MTRHDALSYITRHHVMSEVGVMMRHSTALLMRVRPSSAAELLTAKMVQLCLAFLLCSCDTE